MNYRAGDKVRYIGTAEQDIYHGETVGRVGVLREYCGKLWLENDGMLWTVDLALVERVP